MNREELLKRITRAAKRDKKRRRDPRFLATMGFLVAKGFLRTNQPILLQPNRRLQLDDVVWAGKNVEPRILEVLPAAVLRLPRHFDLDPVKHPELFTAVQGLKKGMEKGEPLWGIPYTKFKAWLHLPLRDRRMKGLAEKKVTKTFRLRPDVIGRLQRLAKELGCSETEALERTLVSAVEWEEKKRGRNVDDPA